MLPAGAIALLLDVGALMVALPMVHAASLHTHGGAVGCVVDGWRSYGGVIDGACCKLALLFVVYGVAGVVGGVAGCWRSHGLLSMAHAASLRSCS